MKTLSFQNVAILFVICTLVSCASPREKSQALTREVLEQLPVPDSATLLHASEFENISRTGMGSFFGAEGLFGSNAEYNHIFEEYCDLLTAYGWQEYSFGDQLRFCNPDYKDVDIDITGLAGFEEYYTEMLAEMDDEVMEKYNTLYIVTVSHYPFDSPSFCEPAD